MDLREQLDAAIGDGPPLRPVDEAVRAGRGALRRRRLTAAGAALAVVAVVGVSTSLAVGDEPRRDSSSYVGTPEPTPQAPATPVVERYAGEVPVGLKDWCKDDPDPECVPDLVGWTARGSLLRLEGVVISRLVRDPVLLGDIERSAAVEATYEGKTWWVHLQWAPGGEGGGMSPAGVDGLTFEQWVDGGRAGDWGGITVGSGGEPGGPLDLEWWDARTGEFSVPDGVTVVRTVDNPLRLAAPHDSKGLVVDHAGTRYWVLMQREITDGGGEEGEDGAVSGTMVEAVDAAYPDFDTWLFDQVALENGERMLQLVELRADGTLAPLRGVSLVRQRANPDMPDDFARDGVPTAVAEVVYRGQTWFVLVRKVGGGPAEYFPSAGRHVPDDLDEFLAWARQRYSAGEEGLR